MQKQETTTQEVERVLNILTEQYRENEGEPLCYFAFVVNPESFAQTIENIFYASFLVRVSSWLSLYVIWDIRGRYCFHLKIIYCCLL